MDNSKKIDLFENTKISKAVIKLIVPTILSSLVMILYNLADTYFVGQLNNPIENAAVTLAAPVLLAFNAINNLFGVGTSSMMSRALGAKDYETVKRSSAFGFYCALICGLVFSVFCTVFKPPLLNLLGATPETATATTGYMKWTVSLGATPAILNVVMAYLVRSEGSAIHASIGTMSGCALNIVLDPIFILPQGLDMGAEGAGLATFISNCVACLYFFILIIAKKKNTFVCINPKEFKLSKPIIKGVCGVGIPASIQNLLNVTGMTVLNNFMSGYSSDAVAAMGIAHKTSMIPMYIAMGISQGVLPLIGYNYASRNIKRMKGSVIYATKLSLIFITATTTLYCVFASDIIRLFMDNENIISYGAVFMRGQSLAQPFLCMDFIAVGVFQACGMGKRSLIFAFMRKIILEIPALFILNALVPMYGLAYAQLFAEIVLATAAIFFLIKIFRDLKKENPIQSQN